MQDERRTAMKGHYFEDLAVGMEASLTQIVKAEDVRQLAEISGDFNPVHFDDEYAAGTIFKKPIAHGMLSASYLSAVFGMRLPGPGAIYISQTLNFRAPVYIGDEVTATVRVRELFEGKRRALFSAVCTVNGKTVLDGEAVLMVPARPTS